jgi:hypothetical protein
MYSFVQRAEPDGNRMFISLAPWTRVMTRALRWNNGPIGGGVLAQFALGLSWENCIVAGWSFNRRRFGAN